MPVAWSIGHFERLIHKINRKANWIACGAVLAMTALICSDVTLRYFLRPIKGSNDIVQILSVVLVAFAMGYTLVLKRHASITLFLSHLSSRARGIVCSITNILSIGLFVVLAWRSCVLARRMWISGEVSMTIGIPIYPLIYCVALGALLLCLVLVADLFKSLREARKE